MYNSILMNNTTVGQILDPFFYSFMILVIFYFLEFVLFMVTAVAQKALIVTTFNKGIRAITEETAKDEEDITEASALKPTAV